MVSVLEARQRAGTPFTSIPRKRTPEEIAQAQAEGNQFIQQREKLTGQLGGGRLAQEKAQTILSQRDQAQFAQQPEIIAQKGIEQQRANIQAQNLENQRLSNADLAQNPPPQQLISPIEQQRQDTRNFFQRAFFPTAEEGAQRRLESFGTTSKAPAIAAGLAAGALTFVGAPLIAPLISAGESVTAGKIATNSILRSSFLSSKIVKGALTLYGLEKITKTPATLSDAENSASDAMKAADGAVLAVRNNEFSIEQAQLILEEADLNINRLERSLHGINKFNLRVALSKGFDVEADISRKRRQLALIRVSLLQAEQESRIRRARAAGL